jgi:acetyltransferase-like isoleucine patch superfamily enzyme
MTIKRAWSSFFNLLKCRPFPHWLTAVYLSIRWRCYVSPDCRVYYPFNIRIGNSAKLIGRITIIANGIVDIGSGVEIWEGSILHCQNNGSIRIGDDTSIGPHVTIYGLGGVTIGKKCSIATKTSIVSSSHRYKNIDTPIRDQGNDLKEIIIQDDVWVCAGVTIALGVIVGHGAVIGANSLVRKDVPPLSLVAGIPSKIIGRRGGSDTIFED